MELSSSQNPEAFIENSTTYSGMMRKNERLSNKQNLFEQCKNIFLKPHENRTPSENQTLLRLIDKSELLKELADVLGLEFIKGILKNAKIETIDERQVVAEEEQNIKYMVIVLEGKLGVKRNSLTQDDAKPNSQSQELQNQSLKTDVLFDRLTILAKKQRDLLRKTSKLKRKNTTPISDYQFYLPVLSKGQYEAAQERMEKSILMNEEFGGKERLNGRFYKNRVVSMEKTTLFIVEMSFLFYWLEVAFKAKLAKNIEKMKTIPAFQTLENEKLSQIILSMKLIKKGKNGVVYSQGDAAEMIYLLVEGQLKMSKEADLFKENPNNLYADRRRLMQQHKGLKNVVSKSFKKDEDDILPYANLTALYNYRPVKKSIEMGLISSFGLFGEQEVILKINRETTVQVCSIEASYYQIQFKKVLEIIGNKNVDKFKQILQASISRKVLYRQSQFAQQVHFQNTTNLNYFYLEQGKTQQPPIKLRLQRINQKVAPNSARASSEHTPFYTTFNFHKMVSHRYSSIDRKEEEKISNEFTTAGPSSQIQFNGAESRMVDITHTWDPIEKKVNQSNILSKRLSPFKHQININQPLIDQHFLNNVEKEQRRINKQFRNIRFSLGKRAK